MPAGGSLIITEEGRDMRESELVMMRSICRCARAHSDSVDSSANSGLQHHLCMSFSCELIMVLQCAVPEQVNHLAVRNLRSDMDHSRWLLQHRFMMLVDAWIAWRM